jgi:hypothetical protein
MTNFPRKRAIPNDTLTAWAQRGAVEAAKRTHNSARAALDAYSWRPEYLYSVYLQGSNRNYTNTPDDSEVDIVVELHSSFSSDLSLLSQPELAAFRAYHADDPQLDWSDFRQHVLSALIGGVGASAIREDARAIFVLADSNGLNANVLVCQERRIYGRFESEGSERYVPGVRFQDRITRRWIDNFPRANIVNGEDKDADGRTDHMYKPTVRMFKNARTHLVNNGAISDGLAPSYFIEGLLYNVPDTEFEGSYELSFGNCLRWLNRASFSGFMCQNEYLGCPSQVAGPDFRQATPDAPAAYRLALSSIRGRLSQISNQR